MEGSKVIKIQTLAPRRALHSWGEKTHAEGVRDSQKGSRQAQRVAEEVKTTRIMKKGSQTITTCSVGEDSSWTFQEEKLLHTLSELFLTTSYLELHHFSSGNVIFQLNREQRWFAIVPITLAEPD